MKRKVEKHLVCSEDTHRKIRRAAVYSDMTIANFLEKLIDDYMKDKNNDIR